jgi:hypothetical protein
MSGSNSSTQDAASEPLSFTVHSVPRPGLGEERTRSGRLKMLLVLLVCAAPVVASYLTYFVIRPQGRTNYSTLIQPTRSMPLLGLRGLDGAAVDSASMKGQWLLITVGPARCDEACDRRLFMQRQLREMLGKDRDRLDKLWLITDAAQPSADLRAAAEGAPAMKILQADAMAVSAWLTPEAGHVLEEHLYLVDPMGEWMMRMPAEPEPAKVKRDLERLLRASSGWDKPGR